MTENARKFKLQKLLKLGQNRYFIDDKSPIKLPSKNVDLSYFAENKTTEILAKEFFISEIPERNRNLVNANLDKPLIYLLNSLCIIQIRKKGHAADDAIILLRRLWEEYPNELKSQLSTKLIISTMQAIALGSDNPIEAAVCYTGITYAKMIKIYESERIFTGLSPDAPYPNKKHHFHGKTNENGLGKISFKGHDIARNLHADIYTLSMASDFAGVLLQELVERMSEQINVFSRLDNERESYFGADSIRDRYSFLKKPIKSGQSSI